MPDPRDGPVPTLAALQDRALSAHIVASFPLRHADGRFVRAGSALVRVKRKLLAVQDDAWQCWWIEPRTRTLRELVAEDTPDGIADGEIAGAAIGIIEADTARWTLLREADGMHSLRKVEGVALDRDRRGGWLLTDPDDARRAAELCEIVLTGF